ncbi:MAG: Gfo/Idh/MocA family oxidoreductase, partial [Flavobacteriaceae bacterium]|nr:Gfo/Idh/MocA family oxidoreductase [Muriicola sp.]NNL39142.1 Gfo/Idh/MocA family oxidoreductase [Flavobacteriaceae bacterium]
MKRRDFLKNTAVASSVSLLPSAVWPASQDKVLRTAHIGVGGMGAEDLKSITSHKQVKVVALCDVDSKNLEAALQMHPEAKGFADYRLLFSQMADEIDAVIVSTPDHTHAPASMLA